MAALENQGGFFDTAEVYGNGESEVSPDSASVRAAGPDQERSSPTGPKGQRADTLSPGLILSTS